MKYLNKVVAIILCVALFFNFSTVAYSAESIDNSADIKSYVVPVISNEYQNQYVTFYEYNGKYYLDLNDIKEFTRCTLTEDEKSLTLAQGVREIVIDKETGHMVDCTYVDQGNITLLRFNDRYLCEGIPMLRYLGAACSIRDENVLEVLMPMYTFWESIMPDYLDYYFDINKLYGGEDSVKISIICDILADILDGVSGHGMMGSYDVHMEDALYEVLKVDMMKYTSVQQSVTEENQKINDFLTSDVYQFILDGSEKTVDATYEVLDYYAGFYLNTQIWKNSYLEKLYFDAGDLKAASEMGSQINKQVYEQSVMQADLKNVKVNKELLSAGMLALDTAVTSYGLMQYDDDTRNLFARTINDDMFAYTRYYGVGWKNVADKISSTLKSNESIIAYTAADKIAGTVVEEVSEFGLTKAVSAFTTKANIYVAAAQLGHFLASLINYNSNQAFSADLNAILINSAQYDVAKMVTQLMVDECEKNLFADEASLNRIKDLMTLYYRMTIAFSENIARSLEEFGNRDREQWIEYFSSTTEPSVSNYAAIYLYRITNCAIVPIVEYAGISDNVITQEWIQNNGIDVQQQLVADAYFDYIIDRYDNEYCYHIPQFNLSGAQFEQINQTIYDQFHDMMVQQVYGSLEEVDYPEIGEIVYASGYHSGFVSVVIQTNSTMWADTGYSVYTISTSTGQEASMDDLLNVYGMDREGFYSLVHSRLKQYWDDARDIRDNVGATFFDDRVNRTLAESNIKNSIPFINPDGELSFVANIYSLAAGDCYLHLINADGEIEMGLQCTVDHSAERAEPSGDPLQYFIENCDRQYFTEADIKDFDHQMCVYARNAVFAKSGRIFTSQELKDFFAKYSWYDPRVEPEDFSNDMLNTIQRSNVDLILAREEELEIEDLMNSLDGEEGIYTRYLHNGGYEEIIDTYYDKDALEISSCLVDLDRDGIDELFLHIETGESGIRGKEAKTFLLDIKDNKVFTAAAAYYGGGSAGGDHLVIKYDRDTQTHVLVRDGYSRDGVYVYISYLEVYSNSGFKAGRKLVSTYYSLYNDWYKDAIDEIRKETTLYYMDEYDFRCYQIDEQYVTKEAFDNAWARYEDAREGFQLKPGTYAKPIA